MSEQRCETCRFWRVMSNREPLHDDDGTEYTVGRCWRYPPTIVALQDDYEHQNRPEVISAQWCGEWQAKEPQTKDQALYALARLTLAGDLEAARALADRVQEME